MGSQVNYDGIVDADLVVAGPSCVLFSRNGRQASWLDPRGRSFLACLQCIRSQAVRETSKLKLFVLESVLGFGDVPKGESSSPASETMLYLEQELGPKWIIWSWKVSTMATGLLQGRERLYICGRPKRLFLTPMPRRQPSEFQFRMIPLEAVLDAALPPEVGMLSGRMAANFSHFKNAHAGEPEGSIVICDLTRAPGKVYQPVSKVGVSPTLTTRNTSLWVFQVKSDRFQRFLTPRERLMLQGFHAEPIMQAIPDSTRQLCAAGNAMSVPAVALTIACGMSEMV